MRPLTEYFWNTQQPEIFLNSYQQKKAFSELKDFEEKLYFESLIITSSKTSYHISTKQIIYPSYLPEGGYDSQNGIEQTTPKNVLNPSVINTTSYVDNNIKKIYNINENNIIENTIIENNITDNNKSNIKDLSLVKKENSKKDAFEQRLQDKTIELAIRYNNQSVEAITNFFADLLSFITLCYLLFALEIQINITKSFLLEVFFGLDDSKKSLLILLITDLLVGYHSSNLWELFFEFLFNHYGLPESQTGIFLLVATLPVLLDVLFKYLIFRHLNRSSPATVATYHAMIE